MWLIVIAVIFALLATCAVLYATILLFSDDDNSVINVAHALNAFLEALVQILLIPVDLFKALIGPRSPAWLGMLLLAAMAVWSDASSSTLLQFVDGAYRNAYALWSGLLWETITVVQFLYEAIMPLKNAFEQFFDVMFDAFWDAFKGCPGGRSSAIDFFVSMPYFLRDWASATADFVHAPVENLYNTTNAWLELQHGVRSLEALADCNCQALAGAWATLADLYAEPRIAYALSNMTSIPVSFVQCIIRTALGNVQPCTHVITGMLNATHDMGFVTDRLTELTLSHAGLDVELPRPFLGETYARAIMVVISTAGTLQALIVNSIGGDVTQRSVATLTKFDDAFMQAHATVHGIGLSGQWLEQSIVGLMEGQVQMAATEPATCNYYMYNYLASQNNFAWTTTCHCQKRLNNACGVQQSRCSPEGVCQNPGAGYQQVFPNNLASPWVKLRTDAATCFDTTHAAKYKWTTAGHALQKGTCNCNVDVELSTNTTYPVYNIFTGKCMPSDELNTPCFDSTKNVCGPDLSGTRANTCGLDKYSIKVPQVSDAPLACLVKAHAAGVVGLWHVAWRAFHKFIFANGDQAVSFADERLLMKNLETFDGVWYPRAASVDCEYRKTFAATLLPGGWPGDRTVNPQMFKCDLPSDVGAVLCDDVNGYCPYNPVGDLPTLNGVVYNNADRFAFYLGAGTFMHHSLGALVTSMLRGQVEIWRINTHALAGAQDFLEGLWGTSGNNFLLKPINCDWGHLYDGPTLPLPNMTGTTPAPAPASCPKACVNVQGETPGTDRYKVLCDICTNSNNDKCEGKSKQAYGATDDASTCVFAHIPEPSTWRQLTWQFQDDTEAVFYNEPWRWCNSMQLEWLFYHINEIGAASENLLALLETSGAMANADDNAVDSKCYIRGDLEDSFSTANDDGTRYLISSNPRMTLLFEEDFKPSANIALPSNDDGISWCPIYGNDLFACNLGHHVRMVALLISNLGRQEVQNLAAVMSGYVNGVQIIMVTRLCELNQAVGAALAGFSGLFRLLAPKSRSLRSITRIMTILVYTAMDRGDTIAQKVHEYLEKSDSRLGKIVQNLCDTDGIDCEDNLSINGNYYLQMLQGVLQSVGDIEQGSWKNTANDLGSLFSTTVVFQIRSKYLGRLEILNAAGNVCAQIPGLDDIAEFVGILETAFNYIMNFATLFIAKLATMAIDLLGALFALIGDNKQAAKHVLDDLASTFMWLVKIVYKQIVEPLGIYIYHALVDGLNAMIPGIGTLLDYAAYGGCEVAEAVVDVACGVCKAFTLFSGPCCGNQDLGCNSIKDHQSPASATAPPTPVPTPFASTRRRLADEEVGGAPYVLTDWRGNSLCTLYGQSGNWTDSTLRTWCMGNRAQVHALRQASGLRLPAALLDDFVQPVLYGLMLAMAAVQTTVHNASYAARHHLPVQDVRIIGSWLLNLVPEMSWAAVRDRWAPALHGKEGTWPPPVTDQTVAAGLYRLADGMDTLPVANVNSSTFPRAWKQAKSVFREGYAAARMPRFHQPLVTAPPIPEAHVVRRRLRELSPFRSPQLVKSPDPCSYMDDSAICTNCVIVDTTVDVTLDISKRLVHFYTTHFNTTVSEMKTLGASPSAEQIKRFVQRKSTTSASTATRSVSEVVSISDSFGEAVADALNGDASELSAGFKQFFTKGPDATDVPIFGRSIWFIVYYFASPCDVTATIGPREGDSSCAQSAGDMSHGLASAAVGLLAWFVLQKFFPFIPLTLFWASCAATFSYLALVYGYVPRCLPSLPICLVSDIKNWLYSTMLAPCFCAYVPELLTPGEKCGVGCAPFTDPPSYQDCPARELGIFWNAAFLLQWQLPGVLLYMRPVLPNNLEVRRMLHAAQLGLPVSAKEKACFFVTGGNLVLNVVLVTTVLVCIPIICARVLRFTYHMMFGLFMLMTSNGGGGGGGDGGGGGNMDDEFDDSRLRATTRTLTLHGLGTRKRR